jgi:hypothetical protein
MAVKNEWLKVALESGWTIPEPAEPSEASGRVTLRLSKSIHERVIDRAEMEGVSLNQLIVNYVTSGIEKTDLYDETRHLNLEVLSQIRQLKDTFDTDMKNKNDRLFELPSGEPWDNSTTGPWRGIHPSKQKRDSALEDNQGNQGNC